MSDVSDKKNHYVLIEQRATYSSFAKHKQLTVKL